MLRRPIIKNSYGVANIGSHGYSTQGKIGGYEIQGSIRFDLEGGGWTSVFYFNDPTMAIPYNGGYYVHDELPAYMVKRKGNWHVGTYEQLENMINEVEMDSCQ